MDQTAFTALCMSAASVLRIEEPDRIDSGFAFTLEDVDVFLFFNEERDPERIFCYVDLGAPDAQEHAQVCERLLERNLDFDRSLDSGVYAFDSESGRAVYCTPMWGVGGLDGDHVAEWLRDCVDDTTEIRQVIANPGAFDASGALLPAHPLFANALA